MFLPRLLCVFQGGSLPTPNGGVKKRGEGLHLISNRIGHHHTSAVSENSVLVARSAYRIRDPVAESVRPPQKLRTQEEPVAAFARKLDLPVIKVCLQYFAV